MFPCANTACTVFTCDGLTFKTQVVVLGGLASAWNKTIAIRHVVQGHPSSYAPVG